MLEKLNSNSDWRGRLAEYDHMQDEAFDKSGAWERLHERMTGKSNKAKIAWYWIAASLLLLTTAITYQLKQPSKSAEVVKAKVAPTNKKIEQKSFVRKQILEVVKEKSPTVSVSFKKKSKPAVKVIQQDSTTLFPAKEQLQLDTVSIPQEAITRQSVTPTKKRLAIMHINELHLPTEQKDRFVHSEKSKREDGLLNGSSLDYPFNSHSSDDNILKIRLSPNN